MLRCISSICVLVYVVSLYISGNIFHICVINKVWLALEMLIFQVIFQTVILRQVLVIKI